LLSDVAIFSIFRRSAEHPIYRVEKRPKLAQRQGQYTVIGMDGRILKRGHDLKTVLRVLERKLIRAVD
jgi:phage gpG-like protein